MLRTRIREFISAAVIQLQAEGALPKFDVPDFAVESPEDSAHGDYATNIALASAKRLKQNPAEVASAIAAKLKPIGAALIADASAAPPGFINITLKDEFLLQSLTDVLGNSTEWGASHLGAGKTVRVEYFQLNIAKRPHVGHLRSAVIGDAIKRLLLASGYRAVSDTHVGDWGTQFGILLKGYKEFVADGGIIPTDADPFDFLETIYVNKSDHLEDIREAGKQEFAKLERGDAENRRIWQWMVEISMKQLEKSASRLGLVPFDMHRPESFYETQMAPIVELAIEKGVAAKTPDGAVVVDLSADGLDEAVLLKSDGASTYLLRDLATIQYAKKELRFSRNLYVVDVRQSHHLKQVFRVAEFLGFEGVGENVHVEFGFMSSPEGALSTRKGTAISLDAVLDEARNRARAVIAEKNPNLKDADAVAESVGVGALKYFDLSHHRRSDIVFRWDEALSFDGNTGPYLQYTHARLKSILRKAAKATKAAKAAKDVALDHVEHRLLVNLLRLPEAVEDALADFAPNILANYLYNLAKLANEFYHSHPVIQEPDEAKCAFRIALVSGVALTLAKGLALLGIAAPEEM